MLLLQGKFFYDHLKSMLLENVSWVHNYPKVNMTFKCKNNFNPSKII